jgi:tetratricopeptide (TPR) repeat protein
VNRPGCHGDVCPVGRSEPQPGLARLWLAEGRVNAAAAAIARVLDEASDRFGRCRVLPAYVEIMLATHEVAVARKAADELFKIAEELEAPFLRAGAAYAQGAVSLAEGDPAGALTPLRRALSILGQTEAPYESARVRVLVGLACRALGDADSAKIELDAACQIFHQVGARPDVDLLRKADRLRPVDLSERTDSSGCAGTEPGGQGPSQQGDLLDLVHQRTHGRQTSAEHLHQLGVSSRTEATAYAFEHSLV